MKLSYSQSLLLTSIILPSIVAYGQGDMQINIYSGNDESCVNGYETHFYPFVDGSCYNYEWEGSTADAIVNCPSQTTCSCMFYYDTNCEGEAIWGPLDECMPGNWGSVECSIKYEPPFTTTYY
jgi:hypothetical protein